MVGLTPPQLIAPHAPEAELISSTLSGGKGVGSQKSKTKKVLEGSLLQQISSGIAEKRISRLSKP
jgi:hypothetical protein